MRYTVIFIFSEDLQQVLMIDKMRGPFIGCLNGIGGKIEAYDQSSHTAAYRELREETGLMFAQVTRLSPLVVLSFPYGVELHVFYGVIKPGAEPKSMEEEKVEWIPITELMDVQNPRLAGEGNIPYFINAALMAMGTELKQEASKDE